MKQLTENIWQADKDTDLVYSSWDAENSGKGWYFQQGDKTSQLFESKKAAAIAYMNKKVVLTSTLITASQIDKATKPMTFEQACNYINGCGLKLKSVFKLTACAMWMISGHTGSHKETPEDALILVHVPAIGHNYVMTVPIKIHY